jgi:uncharacterized protein DUF4238
MTDRSDEPLPATDFTERARPSASLPFAVMGEFDHIVAAMRESPVVSAFEEMSISGDFSALDQNPAKRQHFLSRFLLRKFSFTRDGREGIFQMKAAGRAAPQRVGLKGAASRNLLHAGLDENGELSNRNEGYIALIETHAAPALRCLLEDPDSLSPGQRATIAFFIAVQTMRTPAAAAQVTALAQTAFQNAASEMFSDREAFAERHREFYGRDAGDEEIDAFRREVIDSVREEKVRLVGARGAAFGEGLRHAVELVPQIIAFDWTLLRAPDANFITCDRGYAIHDPTPPVPWAAQGLLSSENTETTFPLSSDACLLLRPVPASAGLSIAEADARQVELINLRTYGWAEEYVFGETQAALVAVRTAARRRPADVIRPRPFSQAIGIEPDPDDDSLARENLRRGWPAQITNSEGEIRDYMVFEVGESEGRRRKRLDELIESRARKRAGVGPNDPLPGRIVSSMVAPVV